jgi:membrane associated rhomboid family serine protease
MVLVAGGNFVKQFLSLNDIGTLVAFGAKTNELLRQGEWFRLITPIFLHGGLLHLASNSWALWTVGPLVEKLYGPARFSLLYLFAGVGGVLGSYLGSGSRPPFVPSVGASGAIFGLFGTLLVFGYKYRQELPAHFQRSIRSGILPVIVLNLFLGFSILYIDNAAHLGGLATGALLAAILPYWAPQDARERRRPGAIIERVGLVLALLLILAAFAAAYQHRQPHLASRTVELERFLRTIEQADGALTSGFRWIAGQEIDRRPEALLDALRQADLALDQLGQPDPVAGQVRQEMQSLVRRQRAMIEIASSGQSVEGWESLGEALLRSRLSVREWIRKDGERYGWRLRDSDSPSTGPVPSQSGEDPQTKSPSSPPNS